MARMAPVAMLFIPCRGGWSHRPDEYASPEWIAAALTYWPSPSPNLLPERTALQLGRADVSYASTRSAIRASQKT